jgi:hypothetical protein
MNALSSRDALFSQLHSTVLKEHGFRKRGHWSIRDQESLLQALYLRASRFGRSDQAVFWIDVQVFSPAWYELAYSPKAFPGVKEGTPGLISEALGLMCDPSQHTFEITAGTPLEGMFDLIREATAKRVLPLLERCRTLEGVLEFIKEKPGRLAHGIGPAGICLLLGRELEARHHMAEAKRLAPHDKSRHWLELRERSMWAGQV